MTNVVKFKPKPVCTNIWNTCTYDDCPLRALCDRFGPHEYLGNCMRYFYSHSPYKPEVPHE
jgi:hypothetical protein